MGKAMSERHQHSACQLCCPLRSDEQASAVKSGAKCRYGRKRQSGSRFTIRIGLLCVLLLCLLLLSGIQTAEAKGGRNRGRNRANGVAPAGVGEATEGRSGSRKKTGKKGKIVGTSEKALIVTESKYLLKDWCKSRPLKQTVRSANGCKGVFINHFCYGQCNSFYIPRDLTSEMEEPAYFKSCSFCKPHREEKVSVTLRCPRKKGSKRSRVIKRMVMKIKECRCIAVPDFESKSMSSSASQSTAESMHASSSSSSTSDSASAEAIASNEPPESRR